MEDGGTIIVTNFGQANLAAGAGSAADVEVTGAGFSLTSFTLAIGGTNSSSGGRRSLKVGQGESVNVNSLLLWSPDDTLTIDGGAVERYLRHQRRLHPD